MRGNHAYTAVTRKPSKAKYYKKHVEHLKAKAIEWNRNHKAARKIITAKWQRDNPDLVNANHREWMKRNPQVRSANESARRTRKEGSGGVYTPAEWNALCKHYHNRCLCCGKKRKLTADHVVPVSKGGSSNISNIQPLCGPCNSSKGSKIFDYRK